MPCGASTSTAALLYVCGTGSSNGLSSCAADIGTSSPVDSAANGDSSSNDGCGCASGCGSGSGSGGGGGSVIGFSSSSSRSMIPSSPSSAGLSAGTRTVLFCASQFSPGVRIQAEQQ